MSPKLIPLVPLLYFVTLGCHPMHPVDVLRPPAAPHPLLNACVDNPEECLPAFERAALKGLKKVAGQALVLHALYTVSASALCFMGYYTVPASALSVLCYMLQLPF